MCFYEWLIGLILNFRFDTEKLWWSWPIRSPIFAENNTNRCHCANHTSQCLKIIFEQTFREAEGWLSEASLKLFLLSWLILEKTFQSRKVIFFDHLFGAKVVQERCCNGAAQHNKMQLSKEMQRFPRNERNEIPGMVLDAISTIAFGKINCLKAERGRPKADRAKHVCML